MGFPTFDVTRQYFQVENLVFPSVIPTTGEHHISLQIIASKVDWLELVSKWFIVFINTLSFQQVTSCSVHSIVTTFRGAVIKVEVANFCAAMDTLIDQDGYEGDGTIDPLVSDQSHSVSRTYMQPIIKRTNTSLY